MLKPATIILVISLLFLKQKIIAQTLLPRPVFVAANSTRLIDSMPASNNKIIPASYNIPPMGIVETLLESKIPAKAILGYTTENRPIDLFYFPGASDERALIMAGVHGSELSSVEIAKKVIEDLLINKETTPYYSVLIIPCLFPDNAAKAESEQSKIGSGKNIGRYSSDMLADPNRQMPSLGKAFVMDNPIDEEGRTIENENQLMLQLIQEFNPDRIANIHAIRDVTKAGIFADPRTDCNGVALGFNTDSDLAISMAKFIEDCGGKVPGNNLKIKPTALYYLDPDIVPAGQIQKRNVQGAQVPDNRGRGVSLGSWATTAVCDEDSNTIRQAIPLLTIEFPGCKRPSDYKDEMKQEWCEREIQHYAAAINAIFLNSVFIEEYVNDTTRY